MRFVSLKNKYILIISISIFLFFVLVFSSRAGVIKTLSSKDSLVINNEKIVIALCPTYYSLADELEKDNFKVIKTSSSAESFALLSDSELDYVLAGRILKPGEGNFSGEFLSFQGYSFLSSYSETIDVSELLNRKIYSDLEQENIKNDLALDNIIFVSDVYSYIDQGLIITSWENTDYSRAEIVHVLEDNGERYSLSRRPILYCQNKCDFNIINKLKKIYE